MQSCARRHRPANGRTSAHVNFPVYPGLGTEPAAIGKNRQLKPEQRSDNMTRIRTNNHLFRGLLQSEDGLISRVLDVNKQSITFEATFGVSDELIEQLQNQPEHIVFSERSRIARLGIQINGAPPSADSLAAGKITLTLAASAMISGYPGNHR